MEDQGRIYPPPAVADVLEAELSRLSLSPHPNAASSVVHRRQYAWSSGFLSAVPLSAGRTDRRFRATGCRCVPTCRCGGTVPPEENLQLIGALMQQYRQIANLAKKHAGSQYLLKLLARGSTIDKEMILSAAINHLGELMMNQFGSHLVQEFIKQGDNVMKMEFVLALTRSRHDFAAVCCNTQGSRSVQRLLEHLTTSYQIFPMIESIIPVTLSLVMDMDGQHVILSCFNHFPSSLLGSIVDVIADHCVEVATNKSGCCVLQRCLQKVQGVQKERLIVEITDNALLLADDSYGNYVLQFVLQLSIPGIAFRVLRQLEGHFVELSMKKCSSNVVEKLLKTVGEAESSKIINELLDQQAVLQVLQDQYGNFVMQTVHRVAKGCTREAVERIIEKNLANLQNHLYGKNVVSKASSKNRFA